MENTVSDIIHRYKAFVVFLCSVACAVVLVVTIQPQNYQIENLRPSFMRSASLPKSSSSGSVKGSSEKPNFVIILADDLAWNSIGYEDYDLTFVTPELTKLAEKGIRMTNYYALEYCNPSRASLLTGRYPVNMGMQFGMVEYDVPWGLRLEETLLPEILSDNGYSNYMFGKWHLGHFNERYLPTARGFDLFTGYLDGQNEYYSKRDPSSSDEILRDFLTMDKDCYYTYDGPNLHNYSTHLYKDLAIETIYNHDQSNPMFMYLAFQAVHIPFVDKDGREIESSFMESTVYDEIMKGVVGRSRQLYAMSLSVLDTAVKQIYDALSDSGMISNTYIIFMSDNGGCYLGGGKSGPLRGTKFTMLEGGTKVDAFIYSYKINSDLHGTNFSNLMHVSDWTPTILELADITYDADDDYSFDGVSQVSAWEGGDSVRTDMVYNIYTNAAMYDFDMWTTGSFAVRNERYKLIHFYNGTYAQWHQYYVEQDDDDQLQTVESDCDYGDYVNDGDDFVYALYDLYDDPYETNNIYTSGDDDDDISSAQAELYELAESYIAGSVKNLYDDADRSDACWHYFRDAGGYIVPWSTGDESIIDGDDDSKSYPSYCGVETAAAITSYTSDD